MTFVCESLPTMPVSFIFYNLTLSPNDKCAALGRDSNALVGPRWRELALGGLGFGEKELIAVARDQCANCFL